MPKLIGEILTGSIVILKGYGNEIIGRIKVKVWMNTVEKTM